MLSEGEIVLARLPQADGGAKLRPVLLLRKLPGFGDYLVCGVSSQLHQGIPGFDLWLDENSAGYASTGLRTASVIRLGFLAVVPIDRMERRLGKLPPEGLKTLQETLGRYLVSR
ncbi:MAG TPA: type II toxin-antitoxin system PemK/MazF family toxin [Bacteroidia bacterium]|nr:type II toxin-antitoxin system PemK/MazF family toxin [Bacteroidia bacterium]